MDPQHHCENFTLKNGVAITLRAIRPDDRQRLLAAFRKLEPSTIYTRFFAPRKEPGSDELEAATNIDFESSVALVATLDDAAGGTIISVGRYVVIPGTLPLAAEVAFTTEEDYQGLGLAGLILRELAAIARVRGITRFVAELLPINAAMLSVFRRSGLATQTRLEDGVLHVEMTL